MALLSLGPILAGSALEFAPVLYRVYKSVVEEGPGAQGSQDATGLGSVGCFCGYFYQKALLKH